MESSWTSARCVAALVQPVVAIAAMALGLLLAILSSVGLVVLRPGIASSAEPDMSINAVERLSASVGSEDQAIGVRTSRSLGVTERTAIFETPAKELRHVHETSAGWPARAMRMTGDHFSIRPIAGGLITNALLFATLIVLPWECIVRRRSIR